MKKIPVCKPILRPNGEQLQNPQTKIGLRIGDMLVDFFTTNLLVKDNSRSLVSLGNQITKAMNDGKELSLDNSAFDFIKKLLVENKYRPDDKQEFVNYFFPFVLEQLMDAF